MVLMMLNLIKVGSRIAYSAPTIPAKTSPLPCTGKIRPKAARKKVATRSHPAATNFPHQMAVPRPVAATAGMTLLGKPATRRGSGRG
jgi:hypothetical protein